MRIYLANVGANISDHGFASPLFEDGRFEFLPIPVITPGLDKSPRYGDLRSHYDRAQDLTSYIPERLRDRVVQYSPEFETFTYCDDCDSSRRAGNLKDVEKGDVLLFLAGLMPWVDGKPRRERYGLHLIGGLQIEKIEEPRPRARSGEWLFAGNKDESRRFNKAVPLKQEICEQVFRDTNDAPWRWGPTKSGHVRSELEVIVSYTRAVRCFFDTIKPEAAERAATLRDWIAKHTGERDAALLGG